MVLINFVAFVVFKILLNLISMQNFWKTVQGDHIFVFNVLLGSAVGFI